MSNLITAKEAGENVFDIRACADHAASFYDYLIKAGVTLQPSTGPFYAPHPFNRQGRIVEYQPPKDFYFEASCSREQMEKLLCDWATGGLLGVGIPTLVRS